MGDDPKAVAELLEGIEDYATYAAMYWYVQPKDGPPVPYRFKRCQQVIEDDRKRLRNDRRLIRQAVLKYRQGGISTYGCGRMQHLTHVWPGITAMSIADKMELPAQWIRRAKDWYSQTPPNRRPQIDASNAIELWFASHRSRYVIGSAEGKTPGMGLTLNAFHGSEVANWLNPEEIQRLTFQAIPTSPQSEVLLESTGEMLGDWWSTFWWAAKRGENEFSAIFLSWLMDPDYRMPAREVLEYNQHEQDLKRLGATDEQLAWRRWKIRNDCNGSEDVFAQQFPSDPNEAFLSGGRNIFKDEHLRAMRLTVRPPVWQGDIRPARDPRSFELVGMEGGPLKIWDHDPRKNEKPLSKWAIGADVQFGDDRGKVRDCQDWDVAYSESLKTAKVGCELRGHWDMGEYAKRLASLGHYYNAAVLAPERNGKSAEGVIRPLLGLSGNDWSYPNIFVRQVLKRFAAPRFEDFGWFTDQTSKQQLVSFTLNALLSPVSMDWASQTASDEASVFVMRPDKRMGAVDGRNDDCVMARMITAQAAYEERASFRDEPERQRDWDAMNPSQEALMLTIGRKDQEDAEREREQQNPQDYI